MICSAQGSNTGESCSPFLLQSLHPIWTLLTHWGLSPSWATAHRQGGCRYTHTRGQFPKTCTVSHHKPRLSQGKGCMSSFTSIFSGYGAETYMMSCLQLPLLHMEEKGSVFNLQLFGPPAQHLTLFWNKTQKLSFCPCSSQVALSFLYLTASTQFQISTRRGGWRVPFSFHFDACFQSSFWSWQLGEGQEESSV